MAAKVAKPAPAGTHTAGIYADMTVDGPEIGTLVVIIDRAKNLPNRKAMGKQDPYCAARLGKEAKKTETDKRGGQTPRWDQELRFTVHDSPDYYKLKVSCFNDDKKTELIGECWLSLEDIVVRGGGQNDLWHNLTCKGRSAGDIRIELTYYDLRPKENKVEERQQPQQANGVQNVVREGVVGPRQPKPIKRRPLPANPTESSSESNMQQTTPEMQYQTPPPKQYVETPNDYSSFTSAGDEQYHQYDDQARRESSPEFSRQLQTHPCSYDEIDGHGLPSLHYATPQHSNPHTPSHASLPALPSQAASVQTYHREDFDDTDVYPDEPYRQDEADLPALSTSHGISKPRPLSPIDGQELDLASPLLPPAQYAEQPPSIHQYQGGADLQGQMVFHESPELWLDTDHDVGNEFNLPPPPPVHRNSGSRATPTSIYQEPQAYSQTTQQGPSSARSMRHSVSGSPLAQVHNMQPDPQNSYSTTPLSRHDNVPTQHHSTSYPSPTQSIHAVYPSAREQGLTTPSSLRTGVEQARPSEAYKRAPRERNSYCRNDRPRQQMPVQQSEPARAPQPQGRPAMAGVSALRDNRGHRNSAPAVANYQVSPDLSFKRKSVSPKPESIPAERRHSQLPFSPDSFDAFNPNMASARSINQHGAEYTTPDQAREAAIQAERDARRGDEPIIGSDGRVIDPSDHLPADTWAPEPEVKTSRKGPEVTLRFKHRPHSTQSLPRAGRPSLAETRPNIMSSPNYTQSAEHSPTMAGQARLQKKSRMGLQQPNSSPIVPTLDSNPPRGQSLPHHYASDFPLRERENSSYANGSTTYGNRSPGSGPPAIPGKIPLDRSQESWTDGSALSDEMRSIDIGVGGGHRARARRYGF